MTMQADDDKWGKIAYEAYLGQTGGRSLVSGAELPKWEDNEDKYRTAWIAVARTVLLQAEAERRVSG